MDDRIRPAPAPSEGDRLVHLPHLLDSARLTKSDEGAISPVPTFKEHTMSTIRTYPQVSYPPHVNPERARCEADQVLDKTETAIKTRSDLRFPEWVRMAAEVLGATRYENDHDSVRQGLSNFGVNTAFSGLIGESFHDGYRDSPNTLALIYDVAPIINFLPQLAISQYQGGRLHRQGTGAAEDIYLGLGGQPWAIDRYSAQAAIDEQDLLNSPTISLQLAASREMGRAAKRCVLDLAWALLLSNPVLADEVACFDAATHNNYAAAALSEGALDSALESLGGQIFRDDEDAPVHINGRGEVLITAPKVYGLARRLARHLQLGNSGDLEVRSESRLVQSIGIADPKSEMLVASPTDSAWLLAVPARTITCLVIGAMDGNLEPQLRVNFFGEGGQPPIGRWGVVMDCKVDVGAVLVNHRGLYFGTGV